MAATALIKITQGPNTDVGGRAVLGTVLDGQVTITNDDNTDVVSWEIHLYDVPPGSALSTGLLASASDNTPIANFVPDVDGSYRVGLIVVGSGGLTDHDIRNFIIPFSTGRGLISPPYQKLPDPLPVLGSGEAGEKPDEMNVGGQSRGWAGDDAVSRKLLHQVLKEVNDIVSVPDYAAASSHDALTVDVFEYLEPIAVIMSDVLNGWLLNSNYSTSGGETYPGVSRFNPSTSLGIEGVSTTNANEVFIDGAWDGTYLWTVGFDGVSSDGLLRRLTPGTPSVFSSSWSWDSGGGQSANAVAYGEGYLWVVDDDALWRIDPTAPGGPYTSVVSGAPLDDVLVDSTTSHYTDLNPRVWVAEASGLGGVRRIELSTPAVDASVPVTNAQPTTLAVGGGFIWAGGTDSGTGAATLYRFDPDPAALDTQSTSINTAYPLAKVLDILYDGASGRLLVYLSQASTIYPVILRVSPTSLAVEDSVILSTAQASAGGPPPKMALTSEGYLLVPVMGPAGNPALFWVDPLNLSSNGEVDNPSVLVWESNSTFIELDLQKGRATDDTGVPAVIGAAYLDSSRWPTISSLKIKFRCILETTDASAGFEATADLYDVEASLGGSPAQVAGSQIDNSGAPDPLIAAMIEADVTSAFSGWDGAGVFEARLWINTAGGGNFATCKSAQLVLEW